MILSKEEMIALLKNCLVQKDDGGFGLVAHKIKDDIYWSIYSESEFLTYTFMIHVIIIVTTNQTKRDKRTFSMTRSCYKLPQDR